LKSTDYKRNEQSRSTWLLVLVEGVGYDRQGAPAQQV